MTKQIVETPDGGVARLIAIGGKPLGATQSQQEITRLETLSADPTIEAHRRRDEIRDATRVQKSMQLLPTAFLYRYIGSAPTSNGPVIRLAFDPNPTFTPPDFESRVLTGIRGEIWIDPDDIRVVRIGSRIFKPVDYGWGILGTLYPGATLQIEQTKTSTCGWQLAHLALHLEGKALMFKSVHIVTDETASNYQWVPSGWTYQDAIRWLLQKPDEQANSKRTRY
ncbi:MAG: hypothetical protein H0U76_16570 [Ktedonobacteraceae bacterium]|nr:hypothetical protein [Ktedonobacteraceae bacterium]